MAMITAGEQVSSGSTSDSKMARFAYFGKREMDADGTSSFPQRKNELFLLEKQRLQGC